MLTALIVGAIIIAVTDIDALRLWGSDPGEAASPTPSAPSGTPTSALFQGAFGSWSAWSETLVAATPLILAGLSVAIGFRAGLFNIGVEGQMIMGGLLATVVGFSLPPARSGSTCRWPCSADWSAGPCGPASPACSGPRPGRMR